MKKLAIALLLLGTLAIAQAEGLRASIETANKKIHAAMVKKDFASLDKIFKAGMTKDFKYVEDGKTQTYSQMMQGIKMGLTQMQNITASTKILTLKENGNMGTCTAEHTMGGTMMGADKKKHTSKFVGTALETYKKVGNEWRMSRMEWKSNKMMIDGKSMAAASKG